MLVIAALIAPLCRADDSLNLADKLLDLTGTASFMQQTFETGIKPSLDQMKAKGAPDDLVEQIHVEARNFFQENFNWEVMKPKLAKLYSDNFTDAELRDMIAFYQTPTGQKTISKMPVLMQQSLVMSMNGVQANMPEFQRRVSALIEDYQKTHPKGAAPSAAAPATVPVPADPAK
jgi:uncharacterized protein